MGRSKYSFAPEVLFNFHRSAANVGGHPAASMILKMLHEYYVAFILSS